jgi:hypothetical protein
MKTTVIAMFAQICISVLVSLILTLLNFSGWTVGYWAGALGVMSYFATNYYLNNRV